MKRVIMTKQELQQRVSDLEYQVGDLAESNDKLKMIAAKAKSERRLTLEPHISSPLYYTNYSEKVTEPWDYIYQHELNFAKGNAIKYITRASKKGYEIDDLKKAIWYLEKEVMRLEKEQEEEEEN